MIALFSAACRALRRAWIKKKIRGWERDLETIARQIRNDEMAAVEIERMLCVEKRRLQCEVQREINETSRSNVRRVDHGRRQQERVGTQGK